MQQQYQRELLNLQLDAHLEEVLGMRLPQVLHARLRDVESKQALRLTFQQARALQR